MAGPIRRFFTNLICGCIYNQDRRKRLRVILNSPIVSYMRFVRQDMGCPVRKIKTFVGYQARSLLISVNDTCIYKFPLRRHNSDDLSMREYRIVCALRNFSPIYVPSVQLLKYRGHIVRKYEFIRGTQFRHLPIDFAHQNMRKIAHQIADCMYRIGCTNPPEISDLKPGQEMQPGYAIGWTQGDIYDNFLVDENTGKVVAMIDWEDAFFGDFSHLFKRKHVSIASQFMDCVLDEYNRLYERGRK